MRGNECVNTIRFTKDGKPQASTAGLGNGSTKMSVLFQTQYLAIAAIIACSCFYIAKRIKEHQDIQALGGYAPIVRARLPFGADVVYRFVRGCRKCRDYEVWQWLYTYSPNSKSKTVECAMGGQRMIFTADADNIRAILATQFGDYGKGEPFHEDWKDFLGDSIFTTDGQQWSESRNLLRPLFIKNRVKDFEIFERHSQKLIGMMGGKGESVDVADLFYR